MAAVCGIFRLQLFGMLKINFFVLGFLLLSVALNAQSTDEKNIRKILADQSAAWNNGQLDAFMKGYWPNDSLEFIGKNGIIYGWQKALDNYKKGYPDTTAMGKLNFEILKIKKLSSKYFFVTGKWYLNRTIGNVGGIFTLLFRKIKNNWFIVVDHTS